LLDTTPLWHFHAVEASPRLLGGDQGLRRRAEGWEASIPSPIELRGLEACAETLGSAWLPSTGDRKECGAEWQLPGEQANWQSRPQPADCHRQLCGELRFQAIAGEGASWRTTQRITDPEALSQAPVTGCPRNCVAFLSGNSRSAEMITHATGPSTFIRAKLIH